MVDSLDDVEVSENDVANIIDSWNTMWSEAPCFLGISVLTASKEDVRPIFSEVDVMPRTHGSCVIHTRKLRLW